MRISSTLKRLLLLGVVLAAGISCTGRDTEPDRTGSALNPAEPGAIAMLAPAARTRAQHVIVRSLSDGHPILGSGATLLRRSDGLTVRVHTRELVPGESVDVFWAIFNHPEACTNPNPLTGAICSPPDLFIADTAGSLHYIATLTADAHGKLSYSASLASGTSAACVGDPFPCSTLTNVHGAEVHSPMFVPDGGAGRQAAQFLPRSAGAPVGVVEAGT